MSATVVVEAPAKVNLHLGVGAARPDGYHSVETVLQAVSLYDTLSLTPAVGLRLKCRPDLGVPARDNLAWKAAERLAARLGRSPDVAIELTKVVPAGAGLGGGSSDAAAVLVGLTALWDLDAVSPAVEEAIAAVATDLGADVPFFLAGGIALFTGRGDVLARRIAAPPFDIVLVKPPDSVVTAQAYAAFDRTPVDASPPDALVSACEAGDRGAVARSLANNLEAIACGLVPEVADALAWLRRAEGVLGATVSGSGSAVFGICADGTAARHAADVAKRQGWWSSAVVSRDTGVAVRLDEEAS